MTAYDIFNGDADGLCALVQLRLAEPRKAVLITGVKRDINLLSALQVKAGDALTVLDISMRTNAKGLQRVLKVGAHVFYVDHHNAGTLPKHGNLFAVIDTRPNICTSLLINKCLNNAFAEWAIVGAFGDNMAASAKTLARSQNISSHALKALKRFGVLLNYNGYGRDVSDLHFAPADLFKSLSPYASPRLCLNEQPHIVGKLQEGYANDMAKAQGASPLAPNVFVLDDAPWARRISGSFGNAMAQKFPDKAHAVLTDNGKGGYTVSVRAPKNTPRGADTLCLSFPTGGGRPAAAGINHLPKEDLDTFVAAFRNEF